MIPKHWIYHMWDIDGDYIGTIPNVKSDFVLTLDIDSAGPSPINIEYGIEYDTASDPVKIITTEDGKAITTEDDIMLTTEGSESNYGVPGTFAYNGNIVRVIEVSDYHPTGKLVYTGQVKRWGLKGAAGLVSMYVRPLSEDLMNYLAKSGEILNLSQTGTANNNTVYGGSGAGGRRIVFGWEVNPQSNISSMVLRLAAQSTPVTFTLFALKDDGGTIANMTPRLNDPVSYGASSAQATVSSTTPAEYTFTFPAPIYFETDGNNLLYILTCSGGSGTGGIFYMGSSFSPTGAELYPFLSDTGSGWSYGLYGNSSTFFPMYVKTYYIPDDTKIVITNFVASNFVKTMMNNYIAEGGVVTYDDANIGNTGESIPEYTLSVNTVKEGLDGMLDFAPRNWYYTIDPGTNDFIFKQANTTVADHVLTFGKELRDFDIAASIENVKNLVYLTGGDTGSENLFVSVENATSRGNYGVALDRITDVRITNESTGQNKANKHLDKNDDEQYETEIELIDGVVDVTQYLPGQTIGFQGFSSLIDSLILPIVRVTRYGERVILSLGVLPYRDSTAVQDMQDKLLGIQTIDNPNAPS